MPSREFDHEVILHNIPWTVYEALDSARGGNAGPRMSYLDGTLELMTPSYDHESISSMIHNLIWAWADEFDVPLVATGSWTQKRQKRKAGAEPDQSYALGATRPKRPDLAVEVVWTSEAIDKLKIYRRLKIPEVWFWRAGLIEVHTLARGNYRRRKQSIVLPGLDLRLLARFVQRSDQLQAVREFRAAFRKTQRH